MELKDITSLVSQVGFPMAVAGYLLLQVVPALKGLTESITKLTVLIETKLHGD